MDGHRRGTEKSPRTFGPGSGEVFIFVGEEKTIGFRAVDNYRRPTEKIRPEDLAVFFATFGGEFTIGKKAIISPITGNPELPGGKGNSVVVVMESSSESGDVQNPNTVDRVPILESATVRRSILPHSTRHVVESIMYVPFASSR
jgi:hypothetical protein